jgi:hypothetical protein
MTFDWTAILGPLLGAVAAYAAIRSDLAVLKWRLDDHHRRLEILEK